ncbi:class I SAM-dependent methyltransferase [Eggerthellaceae bacterium zg-997]|nr:class I SAM-dependent methyltransferase [Eggerthellaceae bacterium zg-997]
MTEPLTPLLTTTDWNSEWKRLQVLRNGPADADAWDRRAPTFPTAHGSQSGYAERFLQLAGIRSHESVMDMGCGTGVLSVPLAEAGHPVIAADFSSGMLNILMEQVAALGGSERDPSDPDVRVIKMSWEDDWEHFGVRRHCVDVALASRSIATSDLEAALMKLDAVARRRVCITLACAGSPRVDYQMLRDLGIPTRPSRDFLYAFNILAANGILPEVAYIPSSRYDSFDSVDEARAFFREMVEQTAAEYATDAQVTEALSRLDDWIERNIVACDSASTPPEESADAPGSAHEQKTHRPSGDSLPARESARAPKLLRTRNKRTMTWAFLAWNKQ